MVRFVTYTMEVGADSAMSADLSAVADALAEGGRYAVELLSTNVIVYGNGAQPDLVFVFEVFDLPGRDEDSADGTTH